MNRNEAIIILTDIISKAEVKNKQQGKELYKSAMVILQDKNSSESDLKALYRNFCGYLAYGEFTNDEYLSISKLIDLLE